MIACKNQTQPILLDDFEIFFEIGSGGQSKVYYGIETITKKPFAIKIATQDTFVPIFTKEVEFLSKLDHPYIIKSHTQLKKSPAKGKRNSYYYAMELAPEGDLFFYLDTLKGGFPEKIIKFYVHQIIESLAYVFSKGCSHNDLKQENILLDQNFDIKLADFGCISHLRKHGANKPNIGSNFVGSEYYVSPELYSGGYPDEKNDLFALGVCIFIQYFGTVPFNKANVTDPNFRYFFQKKQNVFWENLKTRTGKVVPENLKILQNGLFCNDKKRRFSLEEVRNSEWLKETSDEKEVKLWMGSLKLTSRINYFKELNQIYKRNQEAEQHLNRC